MSISDTIVYFADICYRKKHYLCISAPAMTLPAPPPSPGPGAYEIRGFEGAQKHYMSSAAFVSTTSRWAVPHAEANLPGPCKCSHVVIAVISTFQLEVS